MRCHAAHLARLKVRNKHELKWKGERVEGRTTHTWTGTSVPTSNSWHTQHVCDCRCHTEIATLRRRAIREGVLRQRGRPRTKWQFQRRQTCHSWGLDANSTARSLTLADTTAATLLCPRLARCW